MEYNFSDIEKKWQGIWKDKKPFKAENNSSKPKYYVLDMFPYPSGAGLHVGHPLGYIASDIMARYKRHKGFNVLHPMGWDSFGLPAEQYAIQTGQHPKITTEQNIARYKDQMNKIGFSFDWDREIKTSEPEYYKWTQWVFIQIFNSWYNKNSNKAEKIETLIAEFEKNGNENVNAVCDEDTKYFTAAQWKAFSEKEKSDTLMQYRLAYLGEAYVNWCPALGTVLANDEVKDGVSERGGHPVERKLMKQWSMRITAYAQRLLDDLNTIDWSESLKESQRYWIGRSEGTSLKFLIHGSMLTIEVFTTRPDTIFGVSFVTLAPEHELVNKITTKEQKAAVDDYVTKSKSRSERERQADVNKVSGVFTGAYVEHPFLKKLIPIWVGDYVLAGYGTGAVMAVPAHDERDFKFATHFGLEKPQVITPTTEHDFEKASWDEKEGKMINSDFLNGLDVKTAIKKAIETIESKNLGKGKINYRLRDAVFGRQRYWGEPIPIYYKNGIPYAVKEEHLPIHLPEVDKYLPTEDGEPPLARAKGWAYSEERGEILGDKLGITDGYSFENTTMPGWAGSSWYFLRYMDANNPNVFADRKLADYWGNVDLYIGGSEHATGHLLYVRFWTKFLHDLNFISVDEPAKKLINQGMIQGTSMLAYFRNLSTTSMVAEKSASASNFKVFLFDKKSVFKVFTEASKIHIPVDYVTFKEGKYYLTKENFEILKKKDHRFSNAQLFPKGIDNFPEKEIFIDEDKIELFDEVEKMSKSKYNVVSPDDICAKFGADTLRLYEMFLGPLEQSKPWNTNGITGVSGFLKKLWKLYVNGISEEAPTKAELKTLHKTIKKITEDIERFSFNTSVSNFMICVNELTEQKCNKRQILEPLLILVSPYAPHIAEELWDQLGHKESIATAPFPEFNEAHLVEDNFNYPISFNGKTRFNIEMPLTLSAAEIEKLVMEAEQTQKYLEGKQPKKVIVVPKKIVNIVV